MPKRLLLATAAATIVLSGSAHAVPRQVPLSHGWEFRLDPHARGGLNRWRNGGPRGGWKRVSVPHVFDARPLASEFHGTIGWYRLRFRAPATPRGFGWAFRFGAVRRSATVWLNGRRLGAHADPYAPFVLPARGLRLHGVNELVVRVVNRKHALPREGWWNWGGITRPVTLIPRGPVALDDLAVMPRLTCSGPGRCTRPMVEVRGTLHGHVAARVQIRVALRSPRGASTSASFTVRRGSPRVSFSFPLAGTPDLWSPDHPALYRAVVITSVGGRAAQVDSFLTGVRAVEVHGGLLYLNGRRVQLRGASIQEDMPGRGPALRSGDIATIVSELKAVGANVTRAQYGLSDELMSALDRAGILLWNQAPVYHRDLELRKEKYRVQSLALVRHNILAARNHPSLLANSVDNEPIATPDRRPGSRQFLFRARRLAQRLDPITPPAVDIAGRPGVPFERSLSWFPLIGINSYFGWYTGRAQNSVANFSDFEPYIRLMRSSYPRSALVITEFGAEASFDGPADRKGSYEFQSNYLNENLDVIDRNPFLGGAIYWTLREFAVKPHWDGGAGLPVRQRSAIHHKGLISYDGKPKPAWFVARQRFKSTPLYIP